LFEPLQHKVRDWNVSEKIESLQVNRFYLLMYDENSKKTLGFSHSRHGTGTALKPLDEFAKEISCVSDDISSSSDESIIDESTHEITTSYNDNLDPSIHIKKTTWKETSNKFENKGRHSKIGFMERKLKEQTQMIDKRNTKNEKETEETIELFSKAGFFPCNCKRSIDNSRCLIKFTSQVQQLKHVKDCAEELAHHVFAQQSMMSSIVADSMSGKWSLSLACGSMTNRDRASNLNVYEIEDGPSEPRLHPKVANDWFKNGCYRKDINIEKTL
jgi:hypothetical protein